ncbi:hypothetical protein [Streptomyces aidingensis]|uniref:Uncharacterized protein n=1 Tax=Streptomyces aidingensis TaxID=910347 RepID=A0A1I1V2E2_9ACTN|nr:hypothetical protein [Streptomyces aidingensis]SFD74470.1 hypothetical protein SAMN05421773_12721 [Streptomyces aidingensis]
MDQPDHRETTVRVFGTERTIRTEQAGAIRTTRQLEAAHTKNVQAALREMYAAVPDQQKQTRKQELLAQAEEHRKGGVKGNDPVTARYDWELLDAATVLEMTAESIGRHRFAPPTTAANSYATARRKPPKPRPLPLEELFASLPDDGSVTYEHIPDVPALPEPAEPEPEAGAQPEQDSTPEDFTPGPEPPPSAAVEPPKPRLLPEPDTEPAPAAALDRPAAPEPEPAEVPEPEPALAPVPVPGPPLAEDVGRPASRPVPTARMPDPRTRTDLLFSHASTSPKGPTMTTPPRSNGSTPPPPRTGPDPRTAAGFGPPGSGPYAPHRPYASTGADRRWQDPDFQEPGPGGPYGAPPNAGAGTAPPRPDSGAGTGGGRSRTTNKTSNRTMNVNIGGGGRGSGGGNNDGNNDGGQATAGSGTDGRHHQGDAMIARIERIELRSNRDVLALAKAINHLGRELHLILGMRAEELQATLGQYKGRWFTFGAGSKVRARLVAAHLKVSAEAAKALGVGALKMAHAFDRHFVKPEQEARRQPKKPARPQFTIGDD